MTKLPIWRVVISVLIAISLLLNVVLIVGLLRVREGLQSALTVAGNALALSTSEPLAFVVSVDQAIPIQTTVPIEQSFVVPIELDYPLETVVNTYIDIPLLGRQDIAVPVEMVIPISTTLEIPIQMEIPISVTYQLQTEIPVEVQLPPTLLDTLADLIEQLGAGLQFPPR